MGLGTRPPNRGNFKEIRQFPIGSFAVLGPYCSHKITLRGYFGVYENLFWESQQVGHRSSWKGKGVHGPVVIRIQGAKGRFLGASLKEFNRTNGPRKHL